MSRPSSARQPDTRVPSRRPSPTTLAAANAEQATTIVSREATFRDGALLILSYESDNIFIYSSLSYEHVLDSALANIAALRDPRIERSQLRLAVQTRIGSAETLVQVTPDTWPAVATRAQVVTLLVLQPLSASLSPGSRPKLPPVSHTLTSPPQELQPSSSWAENPQSPRQPSWHAPYSSATYPASAQSAPSPDRGGRSQGHPRQPSQVVTNGPPATHYPYAHVHYVPSTPNTVSPSTDVSFMNVRPLSDAERRRDRQDVSYHTEPPKRRWDQVEDAGPEERTTYSSGSSHVGGSYSGSARPGFSAQTEQQKDTRPNKRANPRLEPPRPSVYLQALSKDRFSSMEEGGCFWLQAVYAVRVRPKGPDGPKTLCNACGLSYAKEAARREAAASASSAQAQNLQDQPTSYAHGSDSATNSSRRATGVKTLDGSSTTLSKPDGVFPGQVTSSDSTAPSGQPSRECTTCRRTDSPQWRKGPEGPNTLCNSCGLSWARTQRKSEGIPSRAASSRSASPVAPAYQPSQLAPAVIDPSTPQTESRGRAAPKSLLRNNSDDDEHIRPSPVASLRSRSPENAEGRA